jgi:hypothetical protein
VGSTNGVHSEMLPFKIHNEGRTRRVDSTYVRGVYCVVQDYFRRFTLKDIWSNLR